MLVSASFDIQGGAGSVNKYSWGKHPLYHISFLSKHILTSAGLLVHAMEDQLQLCVMSAKWCWSLAASRSPWSKYTTLQEPRWQSSSGTRAELKLWAGQTRKT